MTKVLEEEFDLPPIPGREDKEIKAVADGPGLRFDGDNHLTEAERHAAMYEGSELPAADPATLNEEPEPQSHEIVPSKEDVRDAIANARKLAKAIPEVRGIEDHERRMNEFTDEAHQTFEDLLELSMTVESQNAGPIANVAATFFDKAMRAQEQILQAKLKLIDAMQANKRLTTEQDKITQRREAEANRKAEADRAFEYNKQLAAAPVATSPGVTLASSAKKGAQNAPKTGAPAAPVSSGTARSELMREMMEEIIAENQAAKDGETSSEPLEDAEIAPASPK